MAISKPVKVTKEHVMSPEFFFENVIQYESYRMTSLQSRLDIYQNHEPCNFTCDQ